MNLCKVYGIFEVSDNVLQVKFVNLATLLNSINSYAGGPTLTSSFSSKRPFLDQWLRTQNEFSPGISFQGGTVGNWHSLVTPNVQNYY